MDAPCILRRFRHRDSADAREHLHVRIRPINRERRADRDIKRRVSGGLSILGVRCVAAPIVDTAGQLRGALSVAGPAYRLSLARLELPGPELTEAARRVGSQLAVSRTDTGSEEVEPVSDGWAFHGAYPV
jgi:DNA-binding IclR family transcriptional regulator